MDIKKIIEESKNKLIYTKMKKLNTPEKLAKWMDENTNYAKANQHRIEYDGDIKKFHNEHPSSEWDQWVGPTPSKTNLNVFDENIKCFK